MARSFSDYAVDVGTGKINPVKSKRWIRNNEAILDDFPTLRGQMEDATTAQKLADDTMLAMSARKKRLQDPNISTAAKYLNSANLGKEVETILKSNNPTRMTNELMRQAKKDTSGAAVEGLKGAFVDHVLEKSSIGAYNEIGEQTLSGRAMLNFLNTHESTLKQVFNPREVSRMRRIGNDLAKIEVFEAAKPGKAEVEMKDIASNALRLTSRVAGAQIGRMVATATGGGTVQTPGIFSEKFKSVAYRLTRDRANQLIHDAVLSKDPTLLKTLLLPIDKPTTGLGQYNMKRLNQRMNLWLEGSGRRVLEDVNED
jgi:hypothetical protein